MVETIKYHVYMNYIGSTDKFVLHCVDERRAVAYEEYRILHMKYPGRLIKLVQVNTSIDEILLYSTGRNS